MKKTDIAAILAAMKSSNIPLLLLSFLLIAAGYLLSALRWQILLDAQNITISLWKLTKYYLVGSFFNNFLPTTIGGDVVRAYDVSKLSSSVSQSFAIILVERLSGIFALIVYAIIGLLFGLSRFGNFPLVWVAAVIFLISIFFLLIGLKVHRKRQIENIEDTDWGILHKVQNKIEKIFLTLEYYKDKKSFIFKAILFAFLLQFNVIVFFYIISFSLELRAPFYYFLTVIPLIHVILMFPVSINGIGIRENAFIFFLSKIGASAAISVAISWLAFSMVLMYALVGGLIYAFRK